MLTAQIPYLNNVKKLEYQQYYNVYCSRSNIMLNIKITKRLDYQVQMVKNTMLLKIIVQHTSNSHITYLKHCKTKAIKETVYNIRIVPKFHECA